MTVAEQPSHSPAPRSLPTAILVTGTDTDVGKTIATAAVAATLVSGGRSVAAYKPTQTGVPQASAGDMAEVARLARVPVREGCRLRAPMAPRAAADLESRGLPRLAEHVAAVTSLAAEHDHVLVEGAGGLLVELTEDGQTLADLALALPGCGVIVVARAALGTLNHTMLTREALAARGIRQLGMLIGSLGPAPTAVETSNVQRLRQLPEGMLGVLPAAASELDPVLFRRDSPRWLTGLAQRMGTP